MSEIHVRSLAAFDFRRVGKGNGDSPKIVGGVEKGARNHPGTTDSGVRLRSGHCLGETTQPLLNAGGNWRAESSDSRDLMWSFGRRSLQLLRAGVSMM